MVCARIVALLVAAALRKLHGVIQILELLHPRCICADDDRLRLRLLTADRLPGRAARRVLTLDAHAVHTRGGHLEVDDALVARVDEPRPRRARAVGLTEHEVVAIPRVFDRAQMSAPIACDAAVITAFASWPSASTRAPP